MQRTANTTATSTRISVSSFYLWHSSVVFLDFINADFETEVI
jgi:hypothetical protein